MSLERLGFTKIPTEEQAKHIVGSSDFCMGLDEIVDTLLRCLGKTARSFKAHNILRPTRDTILSTISGKGGVGADSSEDPQEGNILDVLMLGKVTATFADLSDVNVQHRVTQMILGTTSMRTRAALIGLTQKEGQFQNHRLVSLQLTDPDAATAVHSNQGKPEVSESLQDKYLMLCIDGVHEELHELVSKHAENAVGLLHQMSFDAAYVMAQLIEASSRCEGDTSDLGGAHQISNKTYCLCIRAAAQIAKGLYLKSANNLTRSLHSVKIANELLEQAEKREDVALLRSIGVMRVLSECVAKEPE